MRCCPWSSETIMIYLLSDESSCCLFSSVQLKSVIEDNALLLTLTLTLTDKLLFISYRLAMDTKVEYITKLDITPNPDDEDWWNDVQTFDLGVGNLNLDDGDSNVGGRFAEVSEETVRNMTKKKNAPKTDESTKSGVKILADYCRNAEIVFPPTMATAAELNSVLSRFYIAARTKKGEIYKINSMKSIRFALQRYFLETNHIDIIEHEELTEANMVFQNVLKKVKAAGKGDTVHYPEIEPEDLRKLYSSFDINDPAGLQELCWFNIMFYLIRRGCENVRQMTKSTFQITTDATGKQFIHQKTSELTKNHNENDNNDDTNGEGRIYATGGSKCPVECFKKYLRVLNPNIDALWQRPRAKITIKTGIWYCNVPLGEKSLGGMLPMLSEKYQLSQRYTNHSLRVTSIQVLEDGNVETRHIVRVSGHKNPDSIANYARRLSAAKKRNLSTILAESVGAASPVSGSIETVENKTMKQQRKEPQMISMNDDFDRVLQNLPQQLLNPLNIVPGSFTPILTNCSNITFNVYTNGTGAKASPN